ncbi:NAD-glutamate dehydrogenase [Ciceribacter sp. L1K22]|uniref:NAD-glutamate dehydrogenase n=1 Tax=Ciceribacter sp. L1K22 TaxID=2820275 RepID=UPI001ABE97C8|nr:NAD-glutamate dehydrogenase [Ciceribacter sp. L1K22]MBO3758247.1 NAD-glutamate dehydrogenase [Ciceribacter sp. L1K22]
MPNARKTKREQRFDSARMIAEAIGEPFVAPSTLFARASADDLENYTPEMLAFSAVRAAADLAAWDGTKPSVIAAPLSGVEPAGVPVVVLSIVDVNKPFLYDSVMGEVTAACRDLYLAIHPILAIDATTGAATPANMALEGVERRISYIQLHLAPLGATQIEALIERLSHVLSQVKLASSDWKSMLSTLDGAIAQLRSYEAGRRKSDRDEAVALLEWLRDDNFTFLGMREYIYSGDGTDAQVRRGDQPGLGILSDPDVLVLRQGKHAVMTTPEILAFLQGPDFLIVTKANVKSVVHRRAYMDYVGVKRFDANGRVVGELRIVGLFTSTAYTRSVNQIPLLRAKVERTIDHFGFDPQSHSGRILQNTLESYPRDDLFQIDPDLLTRFAEQIMDLAERPRVRVLPRIDRFDRFVSLIVYVPKEDYNSLVREKIGEYFCSVYEGHVSAYYPAFPEGGVARVHIIIGRSGGKTPRVAQPRLEEKVREITTRWDDEFLAKAGPQASNVQVGRAYQETFSPEEAVSDLRHIHACVSGPGISIEFHEAETGAGTGLYLKIFHSGAHLPLSRRVPLLENLGFTVISERTFDITVAVGDENRLVVLHDMELQLQSGGQFTLASDGPLAKEAFLDAFNGRVDNDAFNRLVLSAGLTARAVTVLRAYAAYLRQAGIVYSQEYIADTLTKYPRIAEAMFSLFVATFDPSLHERSRAQRTADIRRSIEAGLAGVPSLDEDKILRRYLNAIEATLRTNYFQTTDGKPKPMLAFKFDPGRLEGLPEPRPFREIFVFGVMVEGVHLRFGKVARGGLRWSDRAQDYRTEVLGLVKAQQVKNAVIVPVGAKGGFFPKNLGTATSRDEWLRAGTEAYKTYISTLLSITDNIEDGEVVPPAETVRLDEDDPYFVVAADKGTATFSDTANGLAQDAGFWLDDAFASGGSAGYDHKKMGITARGAWEATKRHFREMNIDIQTTPFTVAGVGDMSGDVFGNGMLLSEKIRLVAAFDHRDIFIDPDPDMDRSFAERKRLFELPRSSWQDYDRSRLSKGAMIISRNQKSVALTPEAQRAIGLSQDKASPFEIMSAILRSDVDLLWFGGIGTYIRSATETDAEVGDRANDAIRVTADEVRAKVIGEGANLGVTQKGRIAFALAGGRINSDAIDNSAGVNSSDVEVNIKIALAPAMKEGRLPRPKRDRLLAEMTEEVARLVLRNNYLQTLAISLTELKGGQNREELGRVMSVLEAQGRLNRRVETLPDNDAFAERYGSGRTLTRPEIAVLLSYAKIVLFDELVASTLPDDPYCEKVLLDYFPAKMRKSFRQDILDHRLRREIIATVLANHVINRGGPGFIVSMVDATGALSADIVKTALLVRDALDLPALWARLDALDGKIAGDVQNRLYAGAGKIYFDLTRLLLETGTVTSDLTTALENLSKAVKAAGTTIRQIQPASVAEEVEREVGELVAAGVPRDVAVDVCHLQSLVITPEIMQIRDLTRMTLAKAAEGYFAATAAFRIDDLLSLAARVTTADHYDSQALMRGVDRIREARRRIVCAALTQQGNDRDPVGRWAAENARRLDRVRDELRVLIDSGEASLAKIVVAAGLVSDLAEDRTT